MAVPLLGSSCSRREMLAAGGASGVGLAAWALDPGVVHADILAFRARMNVIAAGRAIVEGAVTLEVPAISENGATVPVTVEVEVVVASAGPARPATLAVPARTRVAIRERVFSGWGTGIRDRRTLVLRDVWLAQVIRHRPVISLNPAGGEPITRSGVPGRLRTTAGDRPTGRPGGVPVGWAVPVNDRGAVPHDPPANAAIG